MTAPSPADQDFALFGFEIAANGQPIDDAYQIAAIESWSIVNKVPRARLVVFDGSAAERTFPISDSATFVPGAEVTISAGYGDSRSPIFSGIVVAHGLDVRRAAAPTLVVELADKAIKMTVSQNAAMFQESNDADVIGKLVSASGLSSDVAAMSVQHPWIVQFGASDWDTMLYRAEMNGMVVTTDAGKITVKAPDTSQSPVVRVAFGESVLELHTEMDALGQLSQSAVKSYAWDIATQEVSEASPSAVTVTEPGNVSSDTLAQVCNASAFGQRTGAPVTKEVLQGWSSARLTRAKLAKIRGRVRFPGTGLVKPGSMITLEGIGDRFNGNVFVSAVHHDIRHNRWYTTAEFGLAADWFANHPSVPIAPAAGHLPPIRGLHTGVVKKIDADPDGHFRVQVTLPMVPDDTGVWARLGSWYASKTFGSVFYPEIGDEVIVGFMNEDPRFPVILGSVYSSGRAPAKTPDEKNNVKALVTRSKLELSFDDDKKVIEIKTPGNQSITISDDAKKVTVIDSQNNTVTLDNSGITLDSASNISITAKGNISVNATGNLTLKANGNASVEGVQVNVKAQAALSAEGTASAELKASGMVTVQGAMVKIN